MQKNKTMNHNQIMNHNKSSSSHCNFKAGRKKAFFNKKITHEIVQNIRCQNNFKLKANYIQLMREEKRNNNSCNSGNDFN